MKIRIRTNYGVWKLDLEESSSTGAALTINDILTSLSERYKLNTSGIVLVKDSMDPNDTTVTPFERDRTLASYQIHHGDMIKISNKLKKVEVEKSYIEDGHLISAGTSYCADEEDPTTTPPAATVATPSAAAKTSMKEELSQKKIAPVQIPETKPSSKEAREADEDPYAAQVKETPSNSVASSDPIDLSSMKGPPPSLRRPLDRAISSLSSHPSYYDFSEDFPQSPEVRPPDESKRMCLYNYDDDQEDDSLHFADLVNHPFMSASLRRNYGENFHLPHHQHRPREDPVPSSTLDPEVIEEMRKAGVPENQIQELIDFHMAEHLDQEIANQRHYEEERGHFPVRYRDLDEQLSRVSGSIAELENRLSHRGGLGRGSGGERRGVPPYGVGIGSSTRTRPNRIGLRDSEDTALLSSRQVSSTSALQRLMDDDLAEFEERQLMDAIRESEELAQREKATAAATEASDSSDEGNSDERQRQQQRESEAEAEAAAVGNSFDVLHESSSSNSEATSPSGSGGGGGGGDVFENEEYDPLLELALKASLEEQKKEEEKRRMEEKKKSEEKKRIRKESPKERVRDRGSMSAAPASATSSGSSSSNSKTPMGSAQSIPNLDFVVSHERKPSFRTEEQRVSQSHVESLSSLSRGPMPSRQAPSTPRSASSRSSSSPRSSIRSSPRNKESPGTSARGGGGGEARWNNSTKPSPRGGISRVSVDRTVSRAPAAAPYVPPRRSSQHSSTALSVAENEMLDRAIALSLADSVEAEATHASRPRASSGLRGGIRDRERDWERERERTWDRDRGTSRSFGTPLDLSDPYAASSSTFDRGGSRLPVQQQQLYYDNEEELARAIAESKRQS